jgi:hypothetical protein
VEVPVRVVAMQVEDDWTDVAVEEVVAVGRV